MRPHRKYTQNKPTILFFEPRYTYIANKFNVPGRRHVTNFTYIYIYGEKYIVMGKRIIVLLGCITEGIAKTRLRPLDKFEMHIFLSPMDFIYFFEKIVSKRYFYFSKIYTGFGSTLTNKKYRFSWLKIEKKSKKSFI